MSFTELVTVCPSGPAPPLSGKMVPTLMSCAITGAANANNSAAASLMVLLMNVLPFFLPVQFTSAGSPEKPDQPGGPENQDQRQHRAQHDLVPVAAEREQILLGDQDRRADQGTDEDAAADQHDRGQHQHQEIGLEHIGADIGALIGIEPA